MHDLDLVMTRRDGRLIVLTQDGRRIWGGADAAFTEGLAGLHGEPFVGVHPIDDVVGRRPAVPGRASMTTAAERTFPRRAPAETPDAEPLTRLLFPDGPPPLPAAMHVNGERMDMAYAVGVLMGNRDLRRRLAAEARAEFSWAA